MLSFGEIKEDEVVVAEAALSKSKAYAIGIGRTTSAVQRESWHFEVRDYLFMIAAGRFRVWAYLGMSL